MDLDQPNKEYNQQRNKNMLLSKCISLHTFLPFVRLVVFFFLVSFLCSLFSFPSEYLHHWIMSNVVLLFYFIFYILIHFRFQTTSFNLTASSAVVVFFFFYQNKEMNPFFCYSDRHYYSFVAQTHSV